MSKEECISDIRSDHEVLGMTPRLRPAHQTHRQRKKGENKRFTEKNHWVNTFFSMICKKTWGKRADF